MRALIVSQYFWPENFRINAIAESLILKGLEIDVLTGKPNYPEGVIYSGYSAWGCCKEEYKKIKIYRVPIVSRAMNSRIRLTANYISFIFSAVFCGSWMLRKRRYDIIFVYGLSPILSAIPALFIGWIKNKKVIIWVQDLWPESLSATGYITNRFILGAVRRLVSFIYRHADLILVQSKAFQDPILLLAGSTPILYYPNSVDDTFSMSKYGKIPYFKGLNDGFSVVFTGNIGMAQDVKVIVEAAELIKHSRNIHLIVVGNGSSREWMLNEKIRRDLSNLHLPGRFPMKVMPGLMQKASILLVTLADSPIFSLTIPNKVQAYMAAGRPIIGCLNGEGARLINESKAGLTVPAGDSSALARAILKLYNMSPKKLKKMGDNGREFFKSNFDENLLTKQLIQYFKSLI